MQKIRNGNVRPSKAQLSFTVITLFFQLCSIRHQVLMILSSLAVIRIFSIHNRIDTFQYMDQTVTCILPAKLYGFIDGLVITATEINRYSDRFIGYRSIEMYLWYLTMQLK